MKGTRTMGEVIMTPCGKVYEHPLKYTRHQNACETCTAERLETTGRYQTIMDNHCDVFVKSMLLEEFEFINPDIRERVEESKDKSVFATLVMGDRKVVTVKSINSLDQFVDVLKNGMEGAGAD